MFSSLVLFLQIKDNFKPLYVLKKGISVLAIALLLTDCSLKTEKLFSLTLFLPFDKQYPFHIVTIEAVSHF